MTTKARIYQPAKTAMQSGRAKTKFWLFEYEPAPKFVNPLTAWTGSSETLQQLRMRFPSKAEAIAFAKEKNIPYEVEEPHQRELQLKTYADNFRFDKVETYQSQNGKKSA